jgi:hypothetical protein
MDRFPPPWRRPPRRPSRGSARSTLVHPSRQLDGSPSVEVWGLCDPGASRLVTLIVLFRDTAAASPPAVHGPRCSRSRRVPGESVDPPENLPKEAPRQGALGQLEHEVASMSDETPAGLEQPQLQARQGPALDGTGEREPPQQIAEVVRDDPREQPPPRWPGSGGTRGASSGWLLYPCAFRLTHPGIRRTGCDLSPK